MFGALDGYPNPWRYTAHPEVWALVIFLVGSYVYLVRTVGPKVVKPGEAVLTTKQRRCFIGAMAILWIASDWPIHDIGEQYLYSVHMLQHMMLSYFMPPLVLLATPEWLARLLVGHGRGYRIFSFFSRPVVAGVLFNMVVMMTHIPAFVNRSVSNGPLHYSLHVLLVTTALLAWMPIVGPLPELQIKPMGKIIALFLMSIVPTVPAGWLTAADGVVYKHYNVPVRVFGMSVISDQQTAGAIMKLGGSAYLWTLMTVMFVRNFRKSFNDDNGPESYVRPLPAAAETGAAQVMTYESVQAAFELTPPAPEPQRSAG